MKILVMGGTRFVGKNLVQKLLPLNYQLTLFNRGTKAAPKGIYSVSGDRNSMDSLSKLKGKTFDYIVDISGRTLDQTINLFKFIDVPIQRYIFMSSAGVYLDSGYWPLTEESRIDPQSRHFEKARVEDWLLSNKIPFTSFRPTYIYGPGNYNPIEKWFFDRITTGSIIPVPFNGEFITQLGHVSDLTDAIVLSLKNIKAINKVYNCSNLCGVTFNQLVFAFAEAANINPEKINIKYFNYTNLEPKARKAFPLRISNFLTDISLITKDLNWIPKYNLIEGLKDSYNNDYIKLIDNKIDLSKDAQLFDL